MSRWPKQNRQKRDGDEREMLLLHFLRFLERFRPELIFIENVPGIAVGKSDESAPLDRLFEWLGRNGYLPDILAHFVECGLPSLVEVCSWGGVGELSFTRHIRFPCQAMRSTSRSTEEPTRGPSKLTERC